jgi:hypothetical protein
LCIAARSKARDCPTRYDIIIPFIGMKSRAF